MAIHRSLFAALVVLSVLALQGMSEAKNNQSDGSVIHIALRPFQSLQEAHAQSKNPDVNFSQSDRVRGSIERSKKRAKIVMSRINDAVNAHKLTSDDSQTINTSISPGIGEYIMSLSIGIPPVQLEATFDTGSDLIWVACSPCENCPEPSTQIFDPAKSSSYRNQPCNAGFCNALPQGQSSCNNQSQCLYEYAYGDGSSTSGLLSSETFTFSGHPLNQIAFGCGTNNSGFNDTAGLVGFGRGTLSLPTQFSNSSSAEQIFAYCLTPSDSDKNSTLFLGAGAGNAFPNASDKRTTDLIVNSAQTSFYYLSLEGVSVDNQNIQIPSGAFDIQSDGSGGLIIDSGTTLTYLEESVYKELIAALSDKINLEKADGSSSVGLDLCFKAPSDISSVVFPKVTLTFRGGADLVWSSLNYMVAQDGLVCASLMSSQGQGVSILGNLGQMDYLFLYDASANKLSFAPAQCDAI